MCEAKECMAGQRKYTKSSCDECGKTYARVDHLVRHRLLHLDERNFICVVCEQGFTTRDYLRTVGQNADLMDIGQDLAQRLVQLWDFKLFGDVS